MRRAAVIVISFSALALAACGPAPATPAAVSAPATGLVGVWASGAQPRPELRLELRADATFTEDLGERVAAYQGRYDVAGDTFTPKRSSVSFSDPTRSAMPRATESVPSGAKAGVAVKASFASAAKAFIASP